MYRAERVGVYSGAPQTASDCLLSAHAKEPMNEGRGEAYLSGVEEAQEAQGKAYHRRQFRDELLYDIVFAFSRTEELVGEQLRRVRTVWIRHRIKRE